MEYCDLRLPIPNVVTMFKQRKQSSFWIFLPHTAHLTLFGRSLLLILSELLANAICWIVAGILFGRHGHSQSILSLALLAWVCAIPMQLCISLTLT
jgi:hypothetical protein